MTATPNLILSLRNGAILATLAATPILVGLLWSAASGENDGISINPLIALLLAWVACTGVIAIQSWLELRRGKSLVWFYPCANCGQEVAIISRRCIRCKQHFSVPPQGIAFRNFLLLGVAVFYATFVLGAFLLRRG